MFKIVTKPVGLGCLLAVTKPNPSGLQFEYIYHLWIYIYDEYSCNCILLSAFYYDINWYISSAIYLCFSSASSWPTNKTYVRIVATTALLDPVRHTAQAMVLLKQSRRIVVETPFSLFLVWVGYSWHDLQLFNWLFQERSGRQRVWSTILLLGSY